MKSHNSKTILVAVVAVAVAICALVFISLKEKGAAPADKPVETVSAQTPASAPSESEVSDAMTPDEEMEVNAMFNGQELKAGNPVVAKVDDAEITRVDVYRYIKTLPENIQKLPPAAVYPLALEQVVNTKLVENKANGANLESDPEVVKQLTMAKEQIVRGVFIQREVDSKITDADLKKAYDDYVSKLETVEERQARHILVDSEDKAKAIIADLEKGGDFAAIAKEKSIDPAAQNGGDLGWFTKADMVPDFANAAYALEKGAYSKAPVKSRFGYHIIQVTDVREQAKPTFEETKPFLQSQLRRDTLENLVKEWRGNAKIEQFDINGEPVQTAVPAPAEAAPAEVAPSAAPADEPNSSN